ncbi:hypothetical protein F0365_15620 [Nonlabens sp. Ci31]|uniref:hypothetical protein n=1 Tax=Nonlabens sp. Ci31 TaxID=2608253 RepID=UPI001463E895|nr:hypothetical protein [Nonlabens sp. Ci31]QJP35728.1 hypothetical protein F0365_15620 [Nonlabens sp. Ci31]
MRLLKSILEFYIRSSFHVAFCFVALFLVFHFWNFSKLDGAMLLLIFCGVVIGYNIIKYAALLLERKDFRFKTTIITSTAIASGIAAYLIIKDSLWTVVMVSLASAFSVFYAFPLIRHHNLRQIPIIKLVLVALSWIIIICFLPLKSVYVNFEYSYDSLAFPITDSVKWLYAIDIIQLFVLIIALCIPFEIRDLQYDSPQLKTLPQMIGIHRTKLLGVVLCVIYLVIEIIQFGFTTNIIAISTYLLVPLIAVFIWFSDVFKSDYYTSFFVEAIPVFWLGMLLVLN